MKVKFYHEDINAYAGEEYTYKTDLSLARYQKVLVPAGDDPELKKAIVTTVDVAEKEIVNQPWAYKIKSIKELDV